MIKVPWPVLILASALLTDLAFSQQTGTLQGMVRDELGNIVADASIKLISRRALIAAAKTDSIGTFRFDTLAPGPYDLQVVKPGLCMSEKLRIDQVPPVSGAVITVYLKTPKNQNNPVPKRIRVASVVQQRRTLRIVAPDYPHEALAAGLGGTVTVEVVLDEDGVPYVVTSESDRDPRLVQAAVAAAKQWRYRSTALNCVPVQVETQIHFEFSAATSQVRL